jgi:pimeloyl-ACP methyl ester carboxylesterase
MISSGVLLIAGLLIALLWTPDLPRTELEARYAAPPSEFKIVEGVRLHLRDSGSPSSPALILLHGFGSSLHTWDAWAAELEKTFRVIRIDLPGSGLTGPDPSGNYSDDRALQIISSLMKALNLEKATLIGNSIGGRIAWSFAAKHPQRIEKLILISPDGFASPGFEYGKAPSVPGVLSLMKWTLPKFLLKMNIYPAYANPKALSNETLLRYHDMMRAPGVRAAMLDRMQQIMLKDPVPILKTIQTPTLLLWGQKDAMIPLSNAQDYLKAIPNSHLISLESLGHVPHEEGPTMSFKPVLKFLTNLSE